MFTSASSCSRMASRVASSWARARCSGAGRHSSRARTRGGNRPVSLARSISHSGCGKLPTTVTGNNGSMSTVLTTPVPAMVRRAMLAAGRWRHDSQVWTCTDVVATVLSTQRGRGSVVRAAFCILTLSLVLTGCGGGTDTTAREAQVVQADGLPSTDTPANELLNWAEQTLTGRCMVGAGFSYYVHVWRE